MSELRPSERLLLLLLACGVLCFPWGCGPKTARVPEPPGATGPQPAEVSGVSRAGYAIQLGAFSVLPNAVQLTERLRARGEKAYYFRHDSGLYKVRLVKDYPTRQAALSKAGGLVSEGVADTYFIVGPDDYALARARVHGVDLLREEIVRTAEGFMGLPYQWGGESPEEGFDCSGLIMAAYQMNGLNIPRSSREQFRRGRVVSGRLFEKADLVFFSIQKGRKVSHVGLYLGDGRFIHAPGTGKRIRVDSLSNPYYRRHYAGARTYL